MTDQTYDFTEYDELDVEARKRFLEAIEDDAELKAYVVHERERDLADGENSPLTEELITLAGVEEAPAETETPPAEKPDETETKPSSPELAAQEAEKATEEPAEADEKPADESGENPAKQPDPDDESDEDPEFFLDPEGKGELDDLVEIEDIETKTEILKAAQTEPSPPVEVDGVPYLFVVDDDGDYVGTVFTKAPATPAEDPERQALDQSLAEAQKLDLSTEEAPARPPAEGTVETGALPIVRETEVAWWCPHCDHSMQHGLSTCASCKAERVGDEAVR